MADFCPTGQEAQTAAGVRSSRFLPKTARRAPQALEAGAFLGPWPKRLFIRSSSILLRRVVAVFCVGKVPPADFDSLRGGMLGVLFVVQLSRFVVGAGWWFFVAFLRLVRN